MIVLACYETLDVVPPIQQYFCAHWPPSRHPFHPSVAIILYLYEPWLFPHIDENTWDLPFCPWLIISAQHPVSWSMSLQDEKTSFFLINASYPTVEQIFYIFSIHWSIDRNPLWCHMADNNASVDMKCRCPAISFGHMLILKLLDCR